MVNMSLAVTANNLSVIYRAVISELNAPSGVL